MRVMVKEAADSRGKFGFFLLLLYLLLEYARPMDDIKILASIRLPMVISIFLIGSWLIKGDFHFIFNSIQSKLMWLFILLLAFYIPFARNNYFAFNQTLSVLEYMPFFLSVILYVNTFNRLRFIFDLWIMILIYVSIKGLLGHGIGGSSFLADENDFTLLLDMLLPFSIFLFMYEDKIQKKMIYLIASILAILNVLVSYSRGGFVGLIVVLMFVWLFSPRKIATLVVVGMLAGLFYFSADEKYWERIGTIAETDKGTAKERLESWEAGWEMFKANPLGVGGNNFPVRFPEYQPADMPKGMYGRAAHSLWFTLISELGIIGVIIYGSLLYYNLRDIFWIKNHFGKSSNDDLRYSYFMAIGFFVSLFGFFTSGTFISVLYYPHYFYLTAFVVVFRKLCEQKNRFAPEYSSVT